MQTAAHKKLTPCDIVRAVCGSDESTASLTEQIRAATEEFTDRRATSAGKTLLTVLTEDARSLPEFEALIVLALAKPRLATKLRFSLSQEGRRLAVLYEHAGDRDRALALLEVLNARVPEDRHVDRDLAAMLRKTGNAGRLVERYLQRAEEAVQEGAPMEAVPWLQEVLLVDRSRSDVARMIRDIRYQEAERIDRGKRLRKRFFVTVFVLATLGFVGWREWNLRESFLAIQDADENRLESLNARIASIDGLVQSNPLWLGRLLASRERVRLKSSVAAVNKRLEELARIAAEQAERSLAQAELARLRGRAAVDNQDLTQALDEFRAALELAPQGWEHTARLERDIAALVELIEETSNR